MTALPFKAALLTISDTASAGVREDLSGQAAAEFVQSQGGHVEIHEIVPDERRLIADKLRHYADYLRVDLILTTGGTGLAPRDVTPEATRDVIQREAPGLAEAMRRETSAQTPMAILSRAVTGVRGSTLIVNLPGSPRGVRQCLDVLAPSLQHGLNVLSGRIRSHDPPEKT
jgi:molybdopterin adenylyltransferase